MNRKNGVLDKAAARLMALDSTTYGDERERAVFMEASTFGMTLGLYVSIAAAVVAAVLGQLLVPVVLLVVMMVPNWSTIWYAHRKGVDISELASRAGMRARVAISAFVFGGLLLVAAAMLYTVTTGHGLIALPYVDLGAEAAHSMVKGALVGAVAGGAIGGIFALAKARKAKRTNAHIQTDLDED